MWLTTRFGFFSAVCAKKKTKKSELNYDRVMLRARRRDHLVKLHKAFPAWVPEPSLIHESTKADYRYRVFIERAVFVRLVTELALDIDYGNFKDKCKDDGADTEDLKFLHAMWGVGYRLQERTDPDRKTAPLFDKQK